MFKLPDKVDEPVENFQRQILVDRKNAQKSTARLAAHHAIHLKHHKEVISTSDVFGTEVQYTMKYTAIGLERVFLSLTVGILSGATSGEHLFESPLFLENARLELSNEFLTRWDGINLFTNTKDSASEQILEASNYLTNADRVQDTASRTYLIDITKLYHGIHSFTSNELYRGAAKDIQLTFNFASIANVIGSTGDNATGVSTNLSLIIVGEEHSAKTMAKNALVIQNYHLEFMTPKKLTISGGASVNTLNSSDQTHELTLSGYTGASSFIEVVIRDDTTLNNAASGTNDPTNWEAFPAEAVVSYGTIDNPFKYYNKVPIKYIIANPCGNYRSSYRNASGDWIEPSIIRLEATRNIYKDTMLNSSNGSTILSGQNSDILTIDLGSGNSFSATMHIDIYAYAMQQARFENGNFFVRRSS